MNYSEIFFSVTTFYHNFISMCWNLICFLTFLKHLNEQERKQIFLVIAWLFRVSFRLFFFLRLILLQMTIMPPKLIVIFIYILIVRANFLTVFHSSDFERIWHYFQIFWYFLNEEWKTQVIFIWIFIKFFKNHVDLVLSNRKVEQILAFENVIS